MPRAAKAFDVHIIFKLYKKCIYKVLWIHLQTKSTPIIKIKIKKKPTSMW